MALSKTPISGPLPGRLARPTGIRADKRSGARYPALTQPPRRDTRLAPRHRSQVGKARDCKSLIPRFESGRCLHRRPNVILILYIPSGMTRMRNMPARPPPTGAAIAVKLAALGERIRARRKALRISATTAAEAAGLSRVTL